MQVPEKLALIGGGILLSSLLVFTLKSQASNILTKVIHPVSNIYDHAGDTQKASEFNDDFQNAQKKGWQNGQWGSAKFYVNDQGEMHVGSGQLQGKLYDVLGNDEAHKVRAINLDGDVQAPQDSSNLFQGRNYHLFPNDDPNYSITAINGLDHLDTSQTINMDDMFYNNKNLGGFLDLSNWNTSHVTNMQGIFGWTDLSELNLHNWDTSHVQDLRWAFFFDSNLKNLDLSDWHANNTSYTTDMFGATNDLQDLDITNLNISGTSTDNFFGGSWVNDSSVRQITIGNNSHFNSNASLPDANWKNGSTTLNSSQLEDGNSHPGTWVKQ